MSEGLQAVWVRLDARPKGPGGRAATPAMIVGGLYRQWSRWSLSGLDWSAAMQWEQLTEFLQQVDKAARSSRAVIVLGDVNLDALRTCDGTYKLRPMLTELRAGMARPGSLTTRRVPRTSLTAISRCRQRHWRQAGPRPRLRWPWLRRPRPLGRLHPRGRPNLGQR
jgi:hypothetical protein